MSGVRQVRYLPISEAVHEALGLEILRSGVEGAAAMVLDFGRVIDLGGPVKLLRAGTQDPRCSPCFQKG